VPAGGARSHCVSPAPTRATDADAQSRPTGVSVLWPVNDGAGSGGPSYWLGRFTPTTWRRRSGAGRCERRSVGPRSAGRSASLSPAVAGTHRSPGCERTQPDSAPTSAWSSRRSSSRRFPSPSTTAPDPWPAPACESSGSFDCGSDAPKTVAQDAPDRVYAAPEGAPDPPPPSSRACLLPVMQHLRRSASGSVPAGTPGAPTSDSSARHRRLVAGSATGAGAGHRELGRRRTRLESTGGGPFLRSTDS